MKTYVRQSKWKQGGLLFVFLLIMIVALSACGGGAPEEEQSDEAPADETPAEEQGDEAFTLTDGMGHEVTVPANPQRIIASYLEDPLVALGYTPVAQWTVGEGRIQHYLQDYLDGIPTIPWDLPFETVLEYEPDLLIIGSESTVGEGKYSQYEKIAPTYVLGDEVNDDWREALRAVGKVLNKEEEAEQILTEYTEVAEEAQQTLQEAIGEESVAAIWLVSKQFYIVSEDLSSGAVLYEDLGLTAPDLVKEVSATGSGNWNPVSLEELANMDVDHLFLVNSDGDEGREMLQEPLWQSIPAVKNDHLYEFDSTTSWLYGGPIANEQIIEHVLTSLVE
ncbi:iron-hydroxamate ABC transporter substrate-binding protein [Alkalihalobacillus oceani]|uniref:iron-hydroxamate ABC transporter substrate-binding protein n=1 Tax=Halalkalibacter oceani TaxID=1653776 RepID=UPI00203EC439|nr:iron-hydroxamate ABC transporter substrate-binding protein [Halalkalibacter oceani]MCM3759915.1 iron-hydroxamate ABC transporter substrate-binding protein [Halalkalibacter oceani]